MLRKAMEISYNTLGETAQSLQGKKKGFILLFQREKPFQLLAQ